MWPSPMNKTGILKVLLVEPAHLPRRTVSLTVHSLGTAAVTEAATYTTAQQLCEGQRFDGAVVALDWPPEGGVCRGLSLIQQIRSGQSASAASIPVAALVESCNAELLQVLRECAISRILIKPFRVRDVIDTIDNMRGSARTA
jgi:CheY-like chemotaxis protein